MSSYNQCFAQFYDQLTDNVAYKSGSDFISGFFSDNGIEQGTILDLGCGTCSVSKYLAKKGYRIIGIDSSAEMLQIASEKLGDIGCEFYLINAKMQDLSLTEQVDGAISTLDSINHLNCAKDVQKVFSSVYKHLKKNGLFIFDVNTVYKHNHVLADNTFVFDEENFFLSWDNELIEENRVRILLDFFIYNGKSYDRHSEDFCETAYSIDTLTKMLHNAGFDNIQIYSDFDKNPPADDSERLFFICKKE
ncbi:MAG: class I SAM-dependent DNA methyltransferase [Eubacterium sp.]